jgi:hypothetical protein
MTRFGLLTCVLCFICGCASDSGNGSWEGVLRDLRGDNMQMRSFSEMRASQDHPLTN